MTTRPLFDTPPAPRPNAKRIKPPVIPVPARTPEIWTIQFTAAPDGNVPPVCRVRRLLKSAWRGYRLKARIIAQPRPAIAVGDSASSQSINGQSMRQTAANRAGFVLSLKMEALK